MLINIDKKNSNQIQIIIKIIIYLNCFLIKNHYNKLKYYCFKKFIINY